MVETPPNIGERDSLDQHQRRTPLGTRRLLCRGCADRQSTHDNAKHKYGEPDRCVFMGSIPSNLAIAGLRSYFVSNTRISPPGPPCWRRVAIKSFPHAGTKNPVCAPQPFGSVPNFS